jgi:hypothetical protein
MNSLGELHGSLSGWFRQAASGRPDIGWWDVVYIKYRTGYTYVELGTEIGRSGRIIDTVLNMCRGRI